MQVCRNLVKDPKYNEVVGSNTIENPKEGENKSISLKINLMSVFII